MAKRDPVTARGAELLALIAASETGNLLLTQEEGQDVVNAGHAAIAGEAQDGLAPVALTDAGKAVLAEAAAKARGYTGNFEIETVPVPAVQRRRGPINAGDRLPKYPFDVLEIGQSFHVAVSDAMPKPEKVLSSSVTTANEKYSEPHPTETEEVTVRTYAKNAAGDFIKGPDGKRIVASETKETHPKRVPTRVFKLFPVDANDPKGKGVRVFRMPLPEAGAPAA